MKLIYRYTSNIIDFPRGDYGYNEIRDFLEKINTFIIKEKGVWSRGRSNWPEK